jgi:endonuclease G, mitochondrial
MVRRREPPRQRGPAIVRNAARQGLSVLAGMTLTVAAAAADDAFGGLPRGADVRVLENPGFVVGYSEARRQALWVGFRATSLKGSHKLAARPGFEIDSRTKARVSSLDYQGARYDRGHLAPNYLIGKLYGREAQRAAFLMSNIAPQSRRLNQLVWQRLEEAEADVVAPRAGEMWIATGPVFGAQPPRLKSGIPVPEAFYRIWLDVRAGGAPAVLAFLIPQDVCGTEPLARYLVSVDDIERRTGLDFFHELADAQEHALERTHSAAGWRLWRFNQLPPRYGEKFDLDQCPT